MKRVCLKVGFLWRCDGNCLDCGDDCNGSSCDCVGELWCEDG